MGKGKKGEKYHYTAAADQFVCECDVVKDSGKEEYLRPFIHNGLDWIYASAHHQLLHMGVA